MAVTSREGLKDYCLRELGHPVLEINIDDDQIEDRIDEAFAFYREYHYDAVEKVYLKHQLTTGDMANNYITVPDAVVGVDNILPLSNRGTGMSLFSIQYQILINDLYSLMSTDIIYYYQVKRHIELLQQILSGTKPIRFNRHMNRLYIDMDWENGIRAGDYIIAEAYRVLDPNTYTDVYNDRWLKRYCTALFKRQWGTNLKKFDNIQLPGGVLLNGQKIYDEAIQDIKDIESQMQSSFELPVDFYTG